MAAKKGITDDQIREAIQEHGTFSAAARALGVIHCTVQQRAKKLGIKSAGHNAQVATDAKLREAYAQCNGNYAEIGRLLGYACNGGGSVGFRLRRLGLPAQGRPTLIDPERLAELRTAGASVSDLAFIFQVSHGSISSKLAQLGLSGAVS